VLDLLDALAGVLGEDLEQPVYEVRVLAHLDLDVGRVAEKPDELWSIMIRLFGSAQRFPLAPAASRTAPHRGRLADADGADRSAQVLHRVVYRQVGGHHAAR
jgi:hypothetical protein